MSVKDITSSRSLELIASTMPLVVLWAVTGSAMVVWVVKSMGGMVSKAQWLGNKRPRTAQQPYGH